MVVLPKIKLPSKLHNGMFDSIQNLIRALYIIIVGEDANKGDTNEEIPGDSWNRMNHTLTNADIERITVEMMKDSNWEDYLKNQQASYQA